MSWLLLRNFVRGPLTEPAPAADDAAAAELAARLKEASRARLGRSLSIREVDAGSCNGCELEIHPINNLLNPLQRIPLPVAARRAHADPPFGTGPVATH